jgi:tripartite-type tricarboxylate transporter receptor subunit TctC
MTSKFEPKLHGIKISDAINLPRRRFSLASAATASLAALGPLAAGTARASDYPNRPVTLVIPWTPGGSTDAALRQLAQSASKHLGQPLITINKPGAGGTLGPGQMAATARPDGYTVSQVATSLLRLPHLQKTTYDPRSDFTYIIGVAAWSTGIVVRADAPWKNWQELAAHARANPGAVSYASSGVGSSAHIFMEDIAQAEGIELLHVPYKGSSEAMLGLLGGEVMLQADALGGVAPLVDEGKLRALVTWGESRHPRWPEVPTLREVGVDIVAAAPYGIAGPKGMDPAIVKILHDAFRKAMEDPQYREVSARYMFEDQYRSSADLEKWALSEYERQGAALRKFGLAGS